MAWPGEGDTGWETLLSREWLVSNGMGGYASGTVCGVPTRRFHGLLVAALPAPHGRTMMFNHLWEDLVLADGTRVALSGEEYDPKPSPPDSAEHLHEFRLEWGLPVWTYRAAGLTVEKRLLLPYRQNTVQVGYRVSGTTGPVRLHLRPAVHFRPHEAPVSALRDVPYVFSMVD